MSYLDSLLGPKNGRRNGNAGPANDPRPVRISVPSAGVTAADLSALADAAPLADLADDIAGAAREHFLSVGGISEYDLRTALTRWFRSLFSGHSDDDRLAEIVALPLPLPALLAATVAIDRHVIPALVS